MTTPPRAPSIAAALALAALLALPGAAPAITIPITGFENGGDPLPSQAQQSGDTFRRRDLFGVEPTGGLRLYAAGTRSNQADAAAVLESDLGLPAGTLATLFGSVPSTGSGPTHGGAFQITFAAEAGDTLLFDWNLITEEVTPETLYTDFAFVHLSFDGTGATVDQSVLGHVGQAGFVATDDADYVQSGWNTASIAIGSTGTHTVTVGVVDVQDTFVNTFAVFDMLRLSRAPEPGTAALLGLGLAGLGWHGRRRH